MNVGLVVAGALCFVVAGGHAFAGRKVLDLLPRNLQPTRFGNGAATRGVFVFTWHALTVMLITTGAMLIAVARGPVDDRGQVAFLVGAAYAAAAVLLIWRSRRRPSDLLRTPVWAVNIVITVLCWLNT
jgi:hypothetical protein